MSTQTPSVLRPKDALTARGRSTVMSGECAVHSYRIYASVGAQVRCCTVDDAVIRISQTAGEVAGVVAVTAASNQGSIAAVVANASTRVVGADYEVAEGVLAGNESWCDGEQNCSHAEGHCGGSARD